MSFHHIPVLLAECIDGLAIRPDGIYLDGTAGGAGHSKEIAARLTTGRLIALDQDPDAVAAASQRLEGLPATVVQSNFRYADRALAQLGVDGLDGVLLDLGVSSHQLDEVSRGFSYQGDAPLDMRMSQSGPTAADLVNTASRAELCRILKEYGEEPYGRSPGRSKAPAPPHPLKRRRSWCRPSPRRCRPRCAARTKTPRAAPSRRCASP